MKLQYALLFIAFIGFSSTMAAQSRLEHDSLETAKSSIIDSSLFHGRWHQVEVILTLDESIGLAQNIEERIEKSIETQKRVKEQIENGELAIITQFNYDGTFSHEIVYSNPAVRFPAWRETGNWNWNENNSTISRKAENKEFTTLELSSVKKVSRDELILEVTFTKGESLGIVETVHFKRFLETKSHKG